MYLPQARITEHEATNVPAVRTIHAASTHGYRNFGRAIPTAREWTARTRYTNHGRVMICRNTERVFLATIGCAQREIGLYSSSPCTQESSGGPSHDGRDRSHEDRRAHRKADLNC